MKIENAIKQTKPFANAYEKLVVNMLYTSTWLAAKQKDFFGQYGLTVKQYNILRILRGAGEPISTAEIRSRMLDRMSDASRIVDRLEKKNLVLKNSCPADQRKVDVTLNEKSRDLLLTIDQEIQTWQNSFLNLNEKEAESLSNLLDKMRS